MENGTNESNFLKQGKGKECDGIPDLKRRTCMWEWMEYLFLKK